jgi:decaprenylphospho-beta-D-ribofuranose 2-oxidase
VTGTTNGELRRLTGWGRTAPSLCRVLTVRTAEEVADAVRRAPSRGVLARGLGRSYGDLAQNGGGLVLEMTGLARVLELDRRQGVVVVDGGCSLGELLRAIVPAGWFLPVTPGTRHVTVGGAIAADVHGKNHHRDGSFGRYVESLVLLDPAGELQTLDPRSTPNEFAATVGGLGLTGVVLEAVLRLLPIETSAMRVDVERAHDLDDALARLRAGDHRYRYSVAWVDLRARGRRFGRSVLMRGDHALRGDLPERRTPGDPLARAEARTLAVPPWASVAPFLRGPAGDVFNELYFRRAPRDGHDIIQSIDAFFYPLDTLRDWSRLYGRGGFLQYQFVVPLGSDAVLHDLVGLLAAARPAPVLAVLKQFGPESGPLSFALAGWTLAVDLALPSPELGPLLDRADELVASAGGRVYLAKDSRLRAEAFRSMYPRFGAWREAHSRLDPAGRMQGDLARRLRIVERA